MKETWLQLFHCMTVHQHAHALPMHHAAEAAAVMGAIGIVTRDRKADQYDTFHAVRLAMHARGRIYGELCPWIRGVNTSAHRGDVGRDSGCVCDADAAL